MNLADLTDYSATLDVTAVELPRDDGTSGCFAVMELAWPTMGHDYAEETLESIRRDLVTLDTARFPRWLLPLADALPKSTWPNATLRLIETGSSGCLELRTREPIFKVTDTGVAGELLLVTILLSETSTALITRSIRDVGGASILFQPRAPGLMAFVDGAVEQGALPA